VNRFTKIALESIENLDLVYRDAVRQIQDGASPDMLRQWWETFFMDYAPYPMNALADEAARQIDWAYIHSYLQEKNQ
jgi:hypothetical protein